MICFPVLILTTRWDFICHVAHKKISTGEYHKIPDFKHETGRAGSWQPAFWHSLFPLPVGCICSRYVKPSWRLATTQLISLSAFFLQTEAKVLAGFQKKFSKLLDHTNLQATESRPNPHRPARAPAPSLRRRKQWTSTDFSSNHCPWKTRSLPVTAHTLLCLKQFCEPSLLHTNTTLS